MNPMKCPICNAEEKHTQRAGEKMVATCGSGHAWIRPELSKDEKEKRPKVEKAAKVVASKPSQR